MRVALDAMGGDNAPAEIVRGAVQAAETGILKPGRVLLVGDRERIAGQLEEAGAAYRVIDSEEPPDPEGEEFPVLHASQVVGMEEQPTQALRQKPDSSLMVATKLVKEGKARALVSAGNTGAVVALATTQLRMLPGIRRPGIAVTIEGDEGPFTVIDVGANVHPKPEHLLHYGFMGACLAEQTLGLANPRVALLNIGGEAGKGNLLAKEVQHLFRSSGLNFIGNVEGQEVFLAASDVIVTEGFVGNVLLKLSEGLATHLLKVVKEELSSAGVSREKVEASLARIWRRCDYSEYGGALLLGVEGVVTICHGRSGARAISNALRLAWTASDKGINEQIVQRIRAAGTAAKAAPGSGAH